MSSDRTRSAAAALPCPDGRDGSDDELQAFMALQLTPKESAEACDKAFGEIADMAARVGSSCWEAALHWVSGSTRTR